MKVMQIVGLGGLILVLMVAAGCRSTPQKSYSKWKAFELRKDLRGDYDKAWEAIVKAVDRMWGVKSRNRDTGYIHTAWIYGKAALSETVLYKTDRSWAESRWRFVILLQSSAITFKMRAEPQRRKEDNDGNYGGWFPDKDKVLYSRTYHDLINEVGRTVLNE